MIYPEFDRSKLSLKPLQERKNDIDLGVIKDILDSHETMTHINEIASAMIAAKEKGRPIIFMIGGHVVRSGIQHYLVDLMEKGFISCLAMNGAVMIHDYEFALIGATTESVARYISEGQFGLWRETGRINDHIADGFAANQGMGECVGEAIERGPFPFRKLSILAAAYRLGIAATVHVGIGYDIIHEHPNCDGAAVGATSYRDFLYFAEVVRNLSGGVVLSFGSAVMAPEVFLKALSMARNIQKQQGTEVRSFVTAVFDLHNLHGDLSTEPDKSTCNYYFRPWKTMLVRTVADGGQSYYVQGRHADTIPALWTAIKRLES
jgi:hypothetical protein